MNVDQILESLPNYAKDLRLNFSSLVRNQTELTVQQLWGTLVASAMASRNGDLIQAVLAEAAQQLSAQALEAAKGAAAVMGMNNVYYRFLHLTSNQKYATIPAKLRMNIIRMHGVDQLDFELWSLAVSAINACGTCVDSHERALRERGMTEETILMAVRVASVVHAIASVLDTENVAAPQAVTA
ncbi:MAG TPA: carboxymuconolactone decarboxylase family protein [Acidobacteriaceae bacterium]|nr:carboxymuconolactone decarboxylase family protein [Acidobacteriaceae bacterium]